MLVPFIGYALGRRFIGYVECSGERLTDLLNRTASVVIREAFVESFEDDTVVNLGDGEVDRSILYAVETSGARGEESSRIAPFATGCRSRSARTAPWACCTPRPVRCRCPT